MKMAVEKQYQSDYEAILAKRHDNGGDYWATSDKRLLKGSPFTTLECPLLLLELGAEPSEPILKETVDLILSTWQKDGRFRVYPKSAVYPCHTINAANTLCHLGYATDSRLQQTFQYLLETQQDDGGWRCNKFSFGRGPETEFSNPGPTLTALDAFRFTEYLNKEKALENAVNFLLEHWTVRKPLGPCHYGIGTLFMQPEYPFGNYNLFVYLYVLSFYDRAKKDRRFLEALNVFELNLKGGKFIVGRVNRKLAGLSFCKKGEPSESGTKKYKEILRNLGREK
jgi:hypothetical protein